MTKAKEHIKSTRKVIKSDYANNIKRLKAGRDQPITNEYLTQGKFNKDKAKKATDELMDRLVDKYKD